jgi:hypothetical protein
MQAKAFASFMQIKSRNITVRILVTQSKNIS